MSQWYITGTIIMGVNQIIKDQDGNTIRVTVITDEGHTATGHYREDDYDSTKDEVIQKVTAEAIKKDND